MSFILSAVRKTSNNTFRDLFIWIDKLIYNLVAFLLQVIFDISDVQSGVFNGLAQDITRKIYLILAIFMVFKVTVALLSYLVNPDAIGDKQQGAGKMISRVMVALVMLLITPALFNLMYEAQGPILRTLPRIVLGVSSYDNDEDNQNNMREGSEVSDSGTRIAWSVFRAFYTKNAECFDGAGYEDPDFVSNRSTGNDAEDVKMIVTDVMDRAETHVNDVCEEKNNNKLYAYDYRPIISTLAGGFLCYTLIGIAIMIAIRMFKMLILQILAPIPILSYIDPKSSKDGAFSKWGKAVLSTWLELFINISIVYLILYFAADILGGPTGDNFVNYVDGLQNGGRKAFFLVFVILGLFSFAMQAPKFIMDILGLKGTGSFGKALGLSAAAGGFLGSGVGAFTARRAAGGNVLQSLGSGLAGGLGGLGAGVHAAMDAKDHSSRAAMDAINRRNASNIDFLRNGGTFGGVVGAGLSRMLTGETDYARMEHDWQTREEELKGQELELKNLQDQNSHRKAIMDRVNSKTVESDWTTGTYKGVTGNYRDYNSKLEGAKSGAGVHGKLTGYSSANGTTITSAKYESLSAEDKALYSAVYDNSQGEYFTFNGQEISMAEAEDIRLGLLDANKEDYYQKTTTGAKDDSAITNECGLLEQAGGTVNATLGGSTGLKASVGEANREISTRSDTINRARTTINSEKTSNAAQAAKANATRGQNGSKK